MADINIRENDKVELISVGLILATNHLQGMNRTSEVPCPITFDVFRPLSVSPADNEVLAFP
jgi:hypothetical protein